jgi:hypothetical protein
MDIDEIEALIDALPQILRLEGAVLLHEQGEPLAQLLPVSDEQRDAWRQVGPTPRSPLP